MTSFVYDIINYYPCYDANIRSHDQYISDIKYIIHSEFKILGFDVTELKYNVKLSNLHTFVMGIAVIPTDDHTTRLFSMTLLELSRLAKLRTLIQ